MMSLSFGCMGCIVDASFGLGDPTADLLWSSITVTICFQKRHIFEKRWEKLVPVRIMINI